MIIPHTKIKELVLVLWKMGGLERGSLTGWPSVDQHYTVAMGQWTLITGLPSSGKSEWLDALMVNLARREEWRFVIYSPENWPLTLHHAKIIEKYVGKPFNPGPNQRVDEDEVEAAEEWMRGKFNFAKPNKPTILAILEEAISSHQNITTKLGVVVDPWNYLEHHRPAGKSETEYVSETLSTVIQWVRDAGCHLWLVAHPSKLQKTKEGKLPVPTPHDIAGSMHWWNKSDNCICIWRDQIEGTQPVDVHVQKVRFKHIGRIGVATLLYDRVTGRYFEQPPRQVERERRDING